MRAVADHPVVGLVGVIAPHAVALAANVDDRRFVEQAVDDGGGHHWLVEDLRTVGAAVLLVLALFAVGALAGVGVYVGFSLLGLLLVLVVFLAFLAVVTWVVANVWKSVMRR